MPDNYVALLGTKGGPAIRPGSTMPTSALYVLNGQKIVVDCGLGVTKGLVDQGMPLQDLYLDLFPPQWHQPLNRNLAFEPTGYDH